MEQMLPDEVLERIFIRLTVFDILRAGCTCTRLRAFISSHYTSISSSSSSSVGLLLFVHPFDSEENSSAWAYDGARDAWLKLSLAFLRPNLPELAYPVASAGGLLCFGSGRDFVICNPISRSWRKIPSLPRIVRIENKKRFHVRFDEQSLQAFGLMRNSITGTYDFFIVHQPLWQSEKGSNLMHYSSSLSQWRGLPPLLMSGSHNLHSNTIISCNSRLYTLWDKGASLVVFAFSDNMWTEIDSPHCISASSSTSSLLNAFLMESCGSLHMVGVVGAVWHPDERPTSVCIWKLHAESNEWMEVTRMPSSLLQEFRTPIHFDELQCWGKNGVMYMKSFRSGVLMLDLAKIEWRWLKDMEMEADLGGLIFEPSLSASV